jgi:hypothetical protein
MSIGHSGESEATAQQTLDWLLEVAPDEFNVTIITCTPGTFYYRSLECSEGWASA